MDQNWDYTFITWNLCNTPLSVKRLDYSGNQDGRMEAAARAICEKNADVVYLCEFAPAKCKRLVMKLERAGYQIYYPGGYNEKKDCRVTAMNVLAVKKDITFYQKSSQTGLSYRYLTGTLHKQGQEPIEFLGIHVPQVSGGNHLEEQKERKREILGFALGFVSECDRLGCRGLLVGDFNCSIGSDAEQYHEYEIFQKIAVTWTDTGAPDSITFSNTRLDYVFASPELLRKYEAGTQVTAEREFKARVSDHRMLVTFLRRRE